MSTLTINDNYMHYVTDLIIETIPDLKIIYSDSLYIKMGKQETLEFREKTQTETSAKISIISRLSNLLGFKKMGPAVKTMQVLVGRLCLKNVHDTDGNNIILSYDEGNNPNFLELYDTFGKRLSQTCSIALSKVICQDNDQDIYQKLQSMLEKKKVPFLVEYLLTIPIKPDNIKAKTPKMQNIEALLKKRVTATLENSDRWELKDIYKNVAFLLNYPNLIRNRISEGKLKLTKKERTAKFLTLDKILSDGDYSPENLAEDPESIYSEKVSVNDALSVLTESQNDNLRLSVFRPLTDSYKKILEMSKAVDICWKNDGNDAAKSFAEQLANDCKENGGSIVYAVYDEKGAGCTFVRDFVCIDRQSRPYLFIDIAEGRKYTHDIYYWKNRKLKGLGLAIATSLYIAKKIGAEYVATGDPGVSKIFQLRGASKVRVGDWESDGSHKVGYAAKNINCVSNMLVRAYFVNSEKYYAIFLE